MALDRESTLNRAEKFLRQGRLDAAIAEYGRVVEDQPGDWNTRNTLGDLHVRAGQHAQAVAQYALIADQFLRDGAYAKAGAFYKKVLKLDGSNERAHLQLAEVAAKQGLLADARGYLNKVAAFYRARDNHRGLAEIALKLDALDPAELDAKAAPSVPPPALPIAEPMAKPPEPVQPHTEPRVAAAASPVQSAAGAPVQPAPPAPLSTQPDEIDLTGVLAELEGDESPPPDAQAENLAATAADDLARLYDLGITLEAAGETARALAVFLEVQRQASGYGDISSRIDRLSRAQTGG